MRNDVTKPILFDQDTNGGRGAGTWQINPTGPSRERAVADQPLDGSSKRWMIAAWAVIAVCGAASIANQILNYH